MWYGMNRLDLERFGDAETAQRWLEDPRLAARDQTDRHRQIRVMFGKTRSKPSIARQLRGLLGLFALQ